MSVGDAELGQLAPVQRSLTELAGRLNAAVQAAAGLTTLELVSGIAVIVTAFVATVTVVSKSCTDLRQGLDDNDAFIGTGGAAQ